MSINLENMTAVQNENQEGILGHLMWYSVGKQLIKTDELKNKLIQSGLEEAWMPNAIRPADAFRRATKEIETRKATANAGVFENYLIREVFADKDYVQRNIVVESVNQAGKRLDYNSKAGVITLDKKNESITFVSENETAKELCMEAEQKFNIFKDNYSAQQLRVMVNKIFQSLAPTPVRLITECIKKLGLDFDKGCFWFINKNSLSSLRISIIPPSAVMFRGNRINSPVLQNFYL